MLKSRTELGTYRVAADFCHDRFCVPCARARGKRIAAIVADWFGELQLKFITLTLRQEEKPLDKTVDHLLASFRRLRQMQSWKKAVYGGVGFVEIKRSEKLDRWNVHLHILAHANYLHYETLSRMWLKATTTSFVTDVREVHDRGKAVQYVCKYASKGIAHQIYGKLDLLSEAMHALTGRKLAITFGTARTLKLNQRGDAGDWEAVCTLAVLRTNAQRGLAWAIALLDLVTEKYQCKTTTTSTRSPPVRQTRLPFSFTSSDPRSVRPAVYRSRTLHGR